MVEYHSSLVILTPARFLANYLPMMVEDNHILKCGFFCWKDSPNSCDEQKIYARIDPHHVDYTRCCECHQRYHQATRHYLRTFLNSTFTRVEFAKHHRLYIDEKHGHFWIVVLFVYYKTFSRFPASDYWVVYSEILTRLISYV